MLTEERLDSEIRELIQEKELLESTLENEQQKVADLVREKMNLKKNMSSMKKKSASKENAQKRKLAEAENEIDKQWLRLKALEKSNADLQQLIDICEGEKLTTLNDGCYTDSVREVVIELLKMNISIRNISPAIQVVIEKLTNRTIDNLPSYGTIHKIMYEAKCLALLEAGKAMLQDKDHESPANVLMNDGTTKRKRKYNAVLIGTSEGLRTLGVQCMASETSESLLAVNQETLKEVSQVLSRFENKPEEETYKKLYASITATMSDRAEVMKCFNKLLSVDREKELSQDEITKTSRAIQNHHCFLHVIINLGDNATSSGLKDLDSCCLSEDASAHLTKGCSSTYTCILLAARLFHQMGSEKYGRSDVFEAYLHSQEDEHQGAREKLGKARQNTQTLAKRSYFEREVGNRAHITFHNGTALWYHKDDVKEVLNALKADGNISEAPQSLEYLLHTKVPLAGARALGIIKFCFTGPFQHAFDIKCGHIVEMVPYTIELRAAIEEYSQDATDLLANPRSVLKDIPVKESKYTKALFEETNDPEMDAFTIMALQLLLGNMLILFERQCEAYLAEGTSTRRWPGSTLVPFILVRPVSLRSNIVCSLTAQKCSLGLPFMYISSIILQLNIQYQTPRLCK